MVAHVFISYKHDDGDFATVLEQRIQNAGFESWLDTDIQAGEKWSRLIDEAIEAAMALVVIMTAEARASEFITYEWSYALGKNKKVIPILLKPTELHPKLGELQYLNFTNRAARPWEKLIQQLQEIKQGHEPLSEQNIDPNVLVFLNDINNVDAKIRAFAAMRLGEIGDVAALPSLLNCLRDNEKSVRFAAVRALGQIGDPDAVVHLQMVLASNESGIRKATVEALGKIGSDSAIAVLLSALRETDIGFPAASALANIGEPAIPGLLEALNDTWDWVQRPAAKALEIIGEPAIPGLIQVLHEGNGQAQKYAAITLKEIGSLEAITAANNWESNNDVSSSDDFGEIPF